MTQPPPAGSRAPTISIVVSSYNYARYVAGTIASALDQTRPAHQVIVVDDGSSDDSLARIAPFADRVTIIARPNGGQASALNAGHAVATGDIILFLDSDDRLLPGCLARIAAAWTDDLAKLHFRLALIDETGARTGETRPAGLLSSGDLVPTILRTGAYRTAPTSGNAFARRALDRLMPLPAAEWLTYADCPLLFLAPFHGRVGAIEDVLGEYRVHAGNASGLVRDGAIQLAAFRGMIGRDLRQDDLLTTFCAANGLPYASGSVLRLWHAIKLRLVSLRLDPAAHPIAGDTARQLLRQAWHTLRGRTDIGTARRLLFLGWAATVAFAPLAMARPLAAMAFTRPNSGGYGRRKGGG